jgi:branched-chain amino acid transport system permease protein
VTLPMKRAAPATYMQFSDHRIYTLLALVLLAMFVLITRMVEQSRFGMHCWRSSRTRRRPKRRASTR